MSTSKTTWVSKSFVVDWYLTDLNGTPTNATVAGTVTLPDGTTTSMVITNPQTGHYRAAYDPQVPGTIAWRLVATGALDSAEEGTVVVRRSLLGLDPITVDPTTSIGLVRLLATDVDEEDPLFTDAQITAFLTLEGSDTRLAAAQALETIATSEALVSKKIRTADGLATDGPAVAAELRARASGLREQAAAGTAGDDSDTLGIVDFTWWP